MAKVLIVDDSKTAVAVVQKILENHGFQTVTADTGESGILKATEEHPDVILMDIAMPGMGGFQATRRLSRLPETENIPIVILSSKDQESDKVWAQSQGAREYLVKPAQENTLLGAIDSVLA